MKTIPHLLIVAALTLTGCGDGDDHDHDHGHDHHHHHHDAPHDGTLVALGDHGAHLEFLIDAEAGTMTMWVLDGEAEKPIRIANETVAVKVSWINPGLPDDPDPITADFVLAAQADELTGDTVGDSSRFFVKRGTIVWDKNLTITVEPLTIKGATYDNIEFKYPEGNEE